jgi:peptidoglycan hydrolase-like protein with peptidoglycan-binding domain
LQDWLSSTPGLAYLEVITPCALDAGIWSARPSTAPAVQPASKDKAGPLAWDEARELQSRLKAAGFDPGPIDGIVGPRTTEAARRYGEARTLRASDPSRDLLVRLRGEPTQSAELSR